MISPSQVEEVRSLRASLERRLGEKAMLLDNISKEKASAKARLADTMRIADASALVQNFGNGLRSEVVSAFEDLLTRGIRHVFDKDYRINIDISAKGNTLQADFFIMLPDGKIVNIAKGEGGGLKDVVGVLQRILYLVLDPSRPARVLFLDENLKALDAGRAPAAFRFIQGITKEMGIQVIWVTHSEASKAMAENSDIGLIDFGVARGAEDVSSSKA